MTEHRNKLIEIALSLPGLKEIHFVPLLDSVDARLSANLKIHPTTDIPPHYRYPTTGGQQIVNYIFNFGFAGGATWSMPANTHVAY
jgi:hypothetical protein